MSRYNWDNLDVGGFDLNHSENFFDFKHSKHEKISFKTDIETLMNEDEFKENDSSAANEQPSQDPLDINKENVKVSVKAEKLLSETYEKKFTAEALLSQSPSSKQPSQDALNFNKENFKVSIKAEKLLSETDEKKLPAEALLSQVPSNLLNQPLKHSKLIKNKEKLPNVLRYAEIYEKNKQNKLKKQLEEDRKNRIFHSRPVPKYNFCYENLMKKREGVITVPITPKVLKSSNKSIERAKKLDELKKKSPFKYHAREPKVLNEEPFIPKRQNRFLEIQPFNLHVEKRLCERKNFDEKFQKHMEEKKRKEEIERMQKEEELAKEFRKLTTFKARPNPFK